MQVPEIIQGVASMKMAEKFQKSVPSTKATKS
jgi:hypothetical protein